jgi:hypothetical protein
MEDRRLPLRFSSGLSMSEVESVSCERREDDESVWRGMLAGLLGLDEKERILTAAQAELEQPSP